MDAFELVFENDNFKVYRNEDVFHEYLLFYRKGSDGIVWLEYMVKDGKSIIPISRNYVVESDFWMVNKCLSAVSAIKK